MKELLKNPRYWKLIAIALFALANLAYCPDRANPNFALLVFYSKLTGAASWILAVRLWNHYKENHLIDDILEYVDRD